ncbi:MAG: histidine kinase [Paraburkholderia sp.]|uniref:sensor histidine kinase n=1 Tax=Paraburkholderia sp. TaxID=1926495 RepID=UPI0012157982|nr:ATP-binding protein [Paraburkholderia sp.]TAM01432.1 MAG: histidine kinase [Paraburkholderia sp.]TAM30142.1 MAG: histidine kinase [Paraburkholderia sp.]
MDTSKIVAVATCAQGEETPRRAAARARAAHGADAPSQVARVRRPSPIVTVATVAPIATAQAARIDADETARRRLARELHDSVGAELAATHFALANVNASLPADASPQCAEALALVARSLNAAAEAVRHVLDGLSAPQLDAGLVAALDEWTRCFGARTGLAIIFVCEADERLARLCPDATLAVFRVAQEALANVARHACAARVDVRLACTARHLTLTIADDGIGLPRGASRTGTGARRNRYGLAGMRERCAAFGGTLRAGTRGALAGTVVRARFAWDALFAAPASPLATPAVKGAHS